MPGHLPSGEIVEERKSELQRVWPFCLKLYVFAHVPVCAGKCVRVRRGQNSTLGVIP